MKLFFWTPKLFPIRGIKKIKEAIRLFGGEGGRRRVDLKAEENSKEKSAGETARGRGRHYRQPGSGQATSSTVNLTDKRAQNSNNVTGQAD